MILNGHKSQLFTFLGINAVWIAEAGNGGVYVRIRPFSAPRNGRLPDGYSRIFKSYVVGPFGLLDCGSATLRCKIGSLPFLGLRPHSLHPGAIQGKEGIKFCHLATFGTNPYAG